MTVSFLFLIRHITGIKKMTLGQWLTVLGPAVVIFGGTLGDKPGNYKLAGVTAFGTFAAGLVNLLKQSPSVTKEEQHAKIVEKVVDSKSHTLNLD